MKYSFLLGLILLLTSAWSKPERNVDLRGAESHPLAKVSKAPPSDTCSALSIFNLLDSAMHVRFFQQRDSVLALQYPSDEMARYQAVDLAPEYLVRFLEDINPDTLLAKGVVAREYNFGKAIEGYEDHIVCKDYVRLFYLGDCSFRMTIHNSFLIPPDWCSEAMVVYAFEVHGGTVRDFARQEAG